MDKSKFIDLIDNYVAGTLSPEGWKQLKAALDDPENLAYLDEELLLTFMNDTYFFEGRESEKRAITEGIMQKIKKLDESNHLAQHPMVAAKKAFIRNWQRAAAVIFFILTGAVSWWLLGNRGNNEKEPVATVQHHIDVPPGKNGAILKLADGREVVLDSLADGVVATQLGTKVELKNGQLVYDADKKNPGEILYNTMTTPKGRQFQLVLPDGTKVWLNAASSIRFPVAFTGTERSVAVTGEAYFEVAHHKQMPFKVLVNNNEIEVLGTHFNINAYDDEATLKTTLLEGKIKQTVNGGAAQKILLPGQQSEVGRDGKMIVKENADTEEAIAWMRGNFQFKSADLHSILRQVARWYDAEIEYNGNINLHFTGQLPRSENATALFKNLALTGEVHFRIEGRKIIVSPS